MNEIVQPEHSSSAPKEWRNALLNPLSQSVILESSLQTRTLEVIRLLAERLRMPEQVLAATRIASAQSEVKFLWDAAFLAGGFPDLALLYLYLAHAFPKEGWEDTAQQYIRLAAQETRKTPLLQPGICAGSSGLASVVLWLSRYDARYQKTNHTLINQVAVQVLERSWQCETAGVFVADYDVITGAAGILGYLLTTASREAVVQEAISTLLSYLVWLGLGEDEQGRKHWFIPPEHFQAPHFYPKYPTGYFDLGLAHGIPGPLAALSLAWQAGYRITGQYEAIQEMSQWVMEYQTPDEWGINWAAGIPLEATISLEVRRQLVPTRTAWCYGAPGVTRALWLAGTALEDEPLRQKALMGFEAVFRRPRPLWSTDSPTLCHGTAGLLLICLHFAQETGSAILRDHCATLVEQILEACSPDHRLGVRDETVPGNFVDDPGLLTGAAGVALVLLAAATPVLPDWDRLFLLT